MLIILWALAVLAQLFELPHYQFKMLEVLDTIAIDHLPS